jgi:hypothetical protein
MWVHVPHQSDIWVPPYPPASRSCPTIWHVGPAHKAGMWFLPCPPASGSRPTIWHVGPALPTCQRVPPTKLTCGSHLAHLPAGPASTDLIAGPAICPPTSGFHPTNLPVGPAHNSQIIPKTSWIPVRWNRWVKICSWLDAPPLPLLFVLEHYKFRTI